MWLPFTAYLAGCAILVEALTNNRELDLKFQLRTPGEWEEQWHQERYSRCRDSITRHLRWACEKDIYKLKRSPDRDIQEIKRAEKSYDENLQDENEINFNRDEDDSESFPWLTQQAALGNMLRSKRGRSKRSGVITQECCSPRGCTWEEYAEYCTQNNRKVPHKRYEYVSDY